MIDIDNVNDLLRCKDNAFKNKYINETIEILNYLIENAKLSKTHLTIIEQIINLLIQLCKSDSEKIIKLAELTQNCLRLKQDFQKEVDIFPTLMKLVNNTNDKRILQKKLMF